jgi:hypothetical protein
MAAAGGKLYQYYDGERADRGGDGLAGVHGFSA